MEDSYPPKVFVSTWLELINSDDISQIRKTLIERNVNRIFGSVELAEMYKENVLDQ